jgi:low temperature requirement protein LtrA
VGTSGRSELERTAESPARVSLLELFFDLVYVVALAQISANLVAKLTWSGAFQSLVLLMALWWVWAITALVTDLYNPEQPAVRALTIWVMLGSLLMAAAVPAAFRAHGLYFAGAYVLIHLVRGAVLGPRVHGKVRRRAIRILTWFIISAVPWIAGGIVHGTARAVLWVVALAIDYTAFRLGYPTPGIGRIQASERFNVLPAHLSERYQQFFIIALGDTILVIGTTFGGTQFQPIRLAGFAVTFVTTVLMWQIYVRRAGELLPEALAASRSPKLIARAPYTHLIMVTGVVVTAAGMKVVLTHPTAETRPAWIALILGGPALFLIGRARFEFEVFGRISRNRPVGALVLVLGSPVAILLPPVLIGLAGAAVLGGVAIADARRARGLPPEAAAPPI